MLTIKTSTIHLPSSSSSKEPTLTSLDNTKSNNTTRRIQSWQRKPGLTASNNARVFVEHHYRDHREDTPTTIELEWLRVNRQQNLEKQPFLVKLHHALTQAEKDGRNDVFSWLPHGRAFKVRNKARFETEVLPQYFRMKNYTSFMRQCNIYNFRRLTRGSGQESSGAHYHEFFLRGRPWLCRSIKRTKVKGVGIKPAAQFEKEPKFFNMPVVDDVIVEGSSSSESESDCLLDLDLALANDLLDESSANSATTTTTTTTDHVIGVVNVISPPSSPVPSIVKSMPIHKKKEDLNCNMITAVQKCTQDPDDSSSSTSTSTPANFEGRQFFPLLGCSSSFSSDTADDRMVPQPLPPLPDEDFIMTISCYDDDLHSTAEEESSELLSTTSLLKCFGNDFFVDDDLLLVNDLMKCCEESSYGAADISIDCCVEDFAKNLMADDDCNSTDSYSESA